MGAESRIRQRLSHINVILPHEERIFHERQVHFGWTKKTTKIASPPIFFHGTQNQKTFRRNSLLALLLTWKPIQRIWIMNFLWLYLFYSFRFVLIWCDYVPSTLLSFPLAESRNMGPMRKWPGSHEGFLKWGYPQSFIYRWSFHETNHPASLGTSILGSPHMKSPRCWESQTQIYPKLWWICCQRTEMSAAHRAFWLPLSQQSDTARDLGDVPTNMEVS